MNTDRLPPHSKVAERGILGGILRDPSMFAAITEIVRPESFYFDAHQRIFGIMRDLTGAGQPIDLVTLSDRLLQTLQLDDVGGHDFLVDVWNEIPTGANVEYHAEIVRDAALARSLIHTATEMLRDAYNRVQPADDLLEHAQRKLFELATNAAHRSELIPSSQFLPEQLQRIDDRIAAGGALDGLATGFVCLDEMLAGLKPGQLVVIGARPSLGKTALAVSIAANIAIAGGPAVMFSLEMPRKEIADRLLSMGSGVPMHTFTRGTWLSPDDSQRLIDASSPRGLGGCPLWLDDSPDQTAARIVSAARRAVSRHKVQFVAVDYLQLMEPEKANSKGVNRAQEVGEMARRMKLLARECGIPVMLLSQLNRECESRGDGKPKLSDLRESGDIEAHVDAVVLLHRQPNQPEGADVERIDALVRKNRNGPTGEVTLNFRRAVMRFENVAK